MRAFIIATLLLAACAPTQATEPAQPPSELAQQIRADLTRLDRELAAPGVFVAGLGETADLGGGLTVRPLSVTQDSRCPVNATCIWAGELRVRAIVSGIGETEIKLGEPISTPAGAIAFAIATPPPYTDWPTAEIVKPAYRFGFRRG
jgi:hypothetical protein